MATLTKKDLMVGDFVVVTYEDGVQRFRKWTCLDFSSEAIIGVEPIKITEEFLKSNGFRKKQGSRYWNLSLRCDEISIRLGDMYSEFNYARLIHNPEDVSEVDYSAAMDLNYWPHIHELQHFCNIYNVGINWDK